MTRRTLYRLFGGLCLFTLIVIGVSHQISSSTPPFWKPDAKSSDDTTFKWVDRSFPELKSFPKLRCASAFIVDNKAGEIIYSRNAQEVRPIASITKLLTALVFLESGTDLNNRGTITDQDAFESSRSRLRPGEEYAVRDLLSAALMSSDNRAARALSHSAGMPQAKFIAEMNDKAHSLGMDSTNVIEPTGLSEQNRSTAHDCAILVNAALQNHLIRHITSTDTCTISPTNRRRLVALGTTNRLLHTDLNFVGAKTGHIDEAGFCIGARCVSPSGDDVTAVVLGAPSSRQRFVSLASALHWAFEVVSSPFNRN
jgi:D-alanyl-D-alanine endopeptidase (penicillin-binding protein 7)